MRKLLQIISLAAIAALYSCTVKENRIDCPTFLDLIVRRQADSIFQGGRAWCYLFDNDGTFFAADSLSEMDGRDTILYYSIQPKRTVTAVVSNREVCDGRVIAQEGEEMCELYSYSKDMVCYLEQIADRIDRQDKQFCRLTIVLTEDAIRLAHGLEATFTSRYNGLTYPFLKASEGQFAFTSVFSDEGEATVRLPRQGGSGLTLHLLQPNGFAAEYDLYEAMTSCHYDWNKDSLEDMTLYITLNTVTGNLVVEDWKTSDVSGGEF